MKALKVFAIAALMVFATSCGVVGSTANTPASTDSSENSGFSVGSAINKIFKDFSILGNIDLSKITNIINIANIAKSIGILNTSAVDDQSFIQGLIAGSEGLITKDNVDGVMTQLKKMAKSDMSALTTAFNGVTSTTSYAAKTAAQSVDTASNSVVNTVRALTGIMKDLSK